MADELLLHPMKTLPLLVVMLIQSMTEIPSSQVTRLKETEASLTSPTSGLVAAASKAWLKVDKRSYLPGLDHRSYYFRGHCRDYDMIIIVVNIVVMQARRTPPAEPSLQIYDRVIALLVS